MLQGDVLCDQAISKKKHYETPNEVPKKLEKGMNVHSTAFFLH